MKLNRALVIAAVAITAFSACGTELTSTEADAAELLTTQGTAADVGTTTATAESTVAGDSTGAERGGYTYGSGN